MYGCLDKQLECEVMKHWDSVCFFHTHMFATTFTMAWIFLSGDPRMIVRLILFLALPAMRRGMMLVKRHTKICFEILLRAWQTKSRPIDALYHWISAIL